jgi:hypothetical protein
VRQSITKPPVSSSAVDEDVSVPVVSPVVAADVVVLAVVDVEVVLAVVVVSLPVSVVPLSPTDGSGSPHATIMHAITKRPEPRMAPSVTRP